MTHYEKLINHLNRHNAEILLNTKRIVIWQYNGRITTDEFHEDGSAAGRSWHKA